MGGYTVGMNDGKRDLERVLEQGYADTRVRVRYAETDQMGIVYHANYLVWFEVGRVELMRQLGLDYRGHGTRRGCADRCGGSDGAV